jgi:hypothetical protein
VCDLETSFMRRPWPTGGPSRQTANKENVFVHKILFVNEVPSCKQEVRGKIDRLSLPRENTFSAAVEVLPYRILCSSVRAI